MGSSKSQLISHLKWSLIMKTINSVGNNMSSITLGKPERFTAEFKALFELLLLLQD